MQMQTDVDSKQMIQTLSLMVKIVRILRRL